MDFFGAIVGGLLTTVTYVVIFFGVYKLFQIAVDIREIKDLVANARRVPQSAAPYTSVSAPTVAPETTRNLTGEDTAAAYAEHLLRAVNAERHSAETATHEVR